MLRLRRFALSALIAVAAPALVLVGCGDDDDTAATGVAETTTSTTDTVGSADTGRAPPATDDGAPGEQIVQISTVDGKTLEGSVYGDGPRGIVLAHMRGADRSTWTGFAQAAAAAGFRVLAFDFRGYGGSTGTVDTELDVDLTAAIEYLTAAGVDDVVVIGASMGGTATINVASKLDLAGAATLSAPAEFLGLPALDVAGDIDEPLLVIAAADDQPYADDATAISDAIIDAGADSGVTRFIVDGSHHGTNLFADHAEDITGWLLDFAADPENF